MMDGTIADMDNNKKCSSLTIRTIQPAVAYANYMPVPVGTQWGERTIPDIELILVVAGAFSYEQRGEEHRTLAPGDVLLIPPHTPHILRRLSLPEQAFFSCIHCELQAGHPCTGAAVFSPTPRRVTHTEGDEALHDLFRRCSETYENYHRYREELMVSIVREIWIRLAGYWLGGQNRSRASMRARTMASYLRKHLHERVTRRTLAREFGITPEHVNALFRRELGMTPTQMLHRERVLRAQRLLRTEQLSVKEVAARVGFDDPLYFSRIFRRVLQRTPRSVQ